MMSRGRIGIAVSCWLLCAHALAQPTAPAAKNAPVANTEPAGSQATPGTEAAPAKQPALTDTPPAADAPSSDPVQPPPSAWDIAQQERRARGETSDEESALVAQLGRTLLALLVVVALIYMFGKFGLSRMAGIPWRSRTSKHLTVVDRLQLDGRNALFLVDTNDGERLLLGTGERGVQVIQTMPKPEANKPVFDEAMQKAAQRSRTQGEATGE